MPFISRKHFEAAMGGARRSVLDSDVRKYEVFAQSMTSSGVNGVFGGDSFTFPGGNAGGEDGTGLAGGDDDDDDDLYD